jgi:hypothetical protein
MRGEDLAIKWVGRNTFRRSGVDVHDPLQEAYERFAARAARAKELVA